MGLCGFAAGIDLTVGARPPEVVQLERLNRANRLRPTDAVRFERWRGPPRMERHPVEESLHRLHIFGMVRAAHPAHGSRYRLCYVPLLSLRWRNDAAIDADDADHGYQRNSITGGS